MFSKKWWGKTLERMARVGAYTLTTLIGSDATGLATLDWKFITQGTLFVILLSFLGSIVTTNMGKDKEDPGIL